MIEISLQKRDLTENTSCLSLAWALEKETVSDIKSLTEWREKTDAEEI